MPLASSSTIAVNGFALREIRKSRNLTPGKLAEAIERDRTYIVKIETGAVDRVGTDTFQRLVAALALEDQRAIQALPFAAEMPVAVGQ